MRSLPFIATLCYTALSLLLSCSSRMEIIPTLKISSNGSTINNASITFDSNAGNLDVEIHSNAKWHVACQAQWVTISQSEGQGNSKVRISVDATSVARSAAVVVRLSDYGQVRNTFNIIQQGPDNEDDPDNGDDNPSENPDNEGENDGNEGENDGADDGKDDNGENGNEDGENGEGGSEDGGTTPDAPSNGDDSDPNDDTSKEYSIITTTSKLNAGTFYLGGYQNSTLYLAIDGISNGHCHTAPYIYNNTGGSLTPQQSDQAIEVTLKAADSANTYYIYFADKGYLYATTNSAGALTFSEEPHRAWKFSDGNGGFIVTQDDTQYVKLIISTNATDRLLRSIDGYEKGNPIVLFRKN